MKKKLICAFCAMLMALAAAMAAIPARADGAWGDLYMYVATGNKGKLHLRAQPDSGSESLGLYRSGTRVLVEGFANGNWASVRVDGRRGYMDVNYLSGLAPAVSGPATLPAVTEDTVLYVQTGNSGKLHLRAKASQDADSLGLYPNGTPVHVTSRSGTWAFVNVNGAMGYMMLNYLSDSAAAPSWRQVTPAPYTGAAMRMYVNTGNTGKLHLRAAAQVDAESLGLYPNGTMVYAASLGNGWSRVTVNGQSGYMMTNYLSLLPYAAYPNAAASPAPTVSPYGYVYRYTPTASPTPRVTYLYYGSPAAPAQQISVYAPQPTTSPVPSLYAGAAATVRNRNSSFVYLRSSRDADRKDNILAQVPVGAQVTLLEMGQYWSKVRYDGMEGYMVSGYLK